MRNTRPMQGSTNWSWKCFDGSPKQPGDGRWQFVVYGPLDTVGNRRSPAPSSPGGKPPGVRPTRPTVVDEPLQPARRLLSTRQKSASVHGYEPPCTWAATIIFAEIIFLYTGPYD